MLVEKCLLNAGLPRTFNLKTASSAEHGKVRNGCILKSLCLGHGGASAGAGIRAEWMDGRPAAQRSRARGNMGMGKENFRFLP